MEYERVSLLFMASKAQPQSCSIRLSWAAHSSNPLSTFLVTLALCNCFRFLRELWLNLSNFSPNFKLLHYCVDSPILFIETSILSVVFFFHFDSFFLLSICRSQVLLAAHTAERIRGEKVAEIQVRPTHWADVLGVLSFHMATAGSEAGFSPAWLGP